MAKCAKYFELSEINNEYMGREIAPSWVQKMAFGLSGAKPLSKPATDHCLLKAWEQSSVEFE